jgi:hypothetical protein
VLPLQYDGTLQGAAGLKRQCMNGDVTLFP